MKIYELSQQGYSLRAAARELGLTFGQVRYLAWKHDIQFNGRRRYDYARIADLRERGLSYGQIAMRVGCQPATAWRAANHPSP